MVNSKGTRDYDPVGTFFSHHFGDRKDVLRTYIRRSSSSKFSHTTSCEGDNLERSLNDHQQLKKRSTTIVSSVLIPRKQSVYYTGFSLPAGEQSGKKNMVTRSVIHYPSTERCRELGDGRRKEERSHHKKREKNKAPSASLQVDFFCRTKGQQTLQIIQTAIFPVFVKIISRCI